MARQKPLGMRIGESVFCGGYLVFALVAAIVFLLGRTGAHPAFATGCGERKRTISRSRQS